MRNLSQLIDEWLRTNQDKHNERIVHFKRRHDILLAITEYRLERVSILQTTLCDNDKQIMDEFYQREIDKLNNELYWLDVKFELNIA